MMALSTDVLKSCGRRCVSLTVCNDIPFTIKKNPDFRN